MCTKLFVLLAGMALLSGGAYAEQPNTKRVTTAHRSMAGLSSVSLYDDYLSAEMYDGLGALYTHSTARYPSNRTTNRFYQQDINVLLATVKNRARSASIAYTDVQYAWGVLFPLKPIYGVKAAIGPMIGAGLGLKNQSRNTNNPINIDALGELLLAGNLTYDIPYRTNQIRLKASVRTPILGLQFAPVRGISYYEMLSFGQFDDAFHFTSLHSKNAWTGQYTVDVPLHFLTLSVGVMHRYSLFKANDMLFKQDTWSFQAGCTFDVLFFTGAARPNPALHVSLDR
jgi:hypothetical protein